MLLWDVGFSAVFLSLARCVGSTEAHPLLRSIGETKQRPILILLLSSNAPLLFSLVLDSVKRTRGQLEGARQPRRQ